MRKLHEYSPEEYKRLFESGFLFEFYPHANGTYEDDVLFSNEFSKILTKRTLTYKELFDYFEEYKEYLDNIDDIIGLENWITERDGFREWLLNDKFF